MGDSSGGSHDFTGSIDGIRLKNYIETDARVKAEYKFSTSSNVGFGAVEND